jgi:hypothetical protein
MSAFSRFRGYPDEPPSDLGHRSRWLPGPGVWGLLAVAAIIALVVVIGAGAWLFSIKGTDSGSVCVVREGGPFDGRDIKEVRQPGSGPKPMTPR